jgi:uncharacterized radical SAM superfamily protein
VISTAQAAAETLTLEQIAQVARHARETRNKSLLLACQRAADTRRHNLAAMRRVAAWINAHTAFLKGLRKKGPR